MSSPATRSIAARGHPWHLLAVPAALAVMLLLAAMAWTVQPVVVGAGAHCHATVPGDHATI